MPDVSTEVAIATTTLGTAAATITFSSIASSYTDLRLVLVGTSVSAQTNVEVTFNSDTGTNYSWVYLGGNGTSAVSSSGTSRNFIRLTNQTNFNDTIPTMRTVDVFSYAGSTNKTVLTTESADLNGSGATTYAAQLWRNTAAINTIRLNAPNANFAIGTTATLYGIL